jgi:D-alanyl-D-alanine dipeptidase
LREESRTRSLPAALAAAWILFCPAAAQEPPREAGRFRRPDLVEVTALDPGIRLDLRYATSDNLTGSPLYPVPRAFLQRPVAKALVRAHRRLARAGLGIVVWDAYRPWSVTKRLWDAAPAEKRQPQFVADPSVGSKHNRGCAVDVTLFDRQTGREASMPSAYDEFTERARADYPGGDPESRRRRDLLRAAMAKEGFSVNDAEWWHFNHASCGKYPILNLDLGRAGR